MTRSIPVCFPLALALLFPFALLAETRTWTNASGVEIEADYLEHGDGQVKIRRLADGRVFTIAVATLSEADRDWLEERERADSPGIYIAAGHGGHRMSSLDGIHWTNHTFWGEPAHNQQDLKAIAAGNGICVVVGGFSKSNILTTTDGVNWHENEFNIGVLSGVFFVDGRFLVFSESGRVAESEDGIAWKAAGDARLREFQAAEAERLGLDEPVKSNIRRWRHAHGLFVGAGDNGIIVSTRDFETWQWAERLEPRSRLFIESEGKGFVVRGDRTLHHSVDGLEWIDVSPGFGERTKLSSLVHDGERFLVNERGTGVAWESSDGRTWSEVKGATFPNTIAAVRPDLYYSFDVYWKFTEEMLISTDGGRNWESVVLPGPAGVTCIVHAGEIPPFPSTEQEIE